MLYLDSFGAPRATAIKGGNLYIESFKHHGTFARVRLNPSVFGILTPQSQSSPEYYPDHIQHRTTAAWEAQLDSNTKIVGYRFGEYKIVKKIDDASPWFVVDYGTWETSDAPADSIIIGYASTVDGIAPITCDPLERDIGYIPHNFYFQLPRPYWSTYADSVLVELESMALICVHPKAGQAIGFVANHPDPIVGIPIKEAEYDVGKY